jgi:hypothetical protein
MEWVGIEKGMVLRMVDTGYGMEGTRYLIKEAIINQSINKSNQNSVKLRLTAFIATAV